MERAGYIDFVETVYDAHDPNYSTVRDQYQKYEIEKNSDAKNNATEFVKNLDLSDVELIKGYLPKLDGEAFDEDDFLDMLEYARAKRLMKKRKDFSDGAGDH
ncbi:hypothetical protein D3C78_1669190 [compost metagenome]